MRSDPLPATHVLQALDLFGPQARPYNFDDMFDCWGLLRRVFDHLDDGYEINEELGDDERSPLVSGWAPLEERGELLPGDVLTSHPHASPEFHIYVYCGRVGDVDLVYDSSPRGEVPLFDEAGRLTGSRPLFTRFMRATETTDRLRHDGGAWLRLYGDRARFVNKAVHARLLAANPGRERDLVKLRRAAGLRDLPSYCTARLETDARGREVYDNLWSRDLDYYVPDGASVLVDADAGRDAARPAPPEILGVPHRIVREGGWVVEWRPGGETVGTVDSWRLEVWEETADLWKHRLLRTDLEAPQQRFEVPADLLRDDARFAVVLWARGRGGFSGDALTTALWRPAPNNELLGYNANRPRGLWPDGLAAVAASAVRPRPHLVHRRTGRHPSRGARARARGRLPGRRRRAALRDAARRTGRRRMPVRAAHRRMARRPHLRLVRRRPRRRGSLVLRPVRRRVQNGGGPVSTDRGGRA